jgi:hypothetical protein
MRMHGLALFSRLLKKAFTLEKRTSGAKAPKHFQRLAARVNSCPSRFLLTSSLFQQPVRDLGFRHAPQKAGRPAFVQFTTGRRPTTEGHAGIHSAIHRVPSQGIK